MKKFDYETIKNIYHLRSCGWTITRIAEEYGVSSQHMGQVIKNNEYHRDTKEDRTLGLSSRVINSLRRSNIPVDALVMASQIEVLLRTEGIGHRSLMEIGTMLLSRNMIPNVEEWIESGWRKIRLSNNKVRKFGRLPSIHYQFSDHSEREQCI
jgi:hypothetical protein